MVRNTPHNKKALHRWAFTASLSVIVLLCPLKANAQQMNIQLVVENEFAISGLRTPDWGLVPTGSGKTFLHANDEQAGIFIISATENTHVLLNLDAPEQLVSDKGNTIAFAPEVAFVQDGISDARLAKPIACNRAYFPLSTGNLILDQNIFERIQELRTTVFFYGSVYVGDVMPGIYFGVVTVNVEYL